MVVPEPAPPGFRPADVVNVTALWPFTDPAFSTGIFGSPGGGEAEARLRALVRDIARAEPADATPMGGIAEGALGRPPPDTTLWPTAVDADAVPAPVPSDSAAWTIEGRALEALHRRNYEARGAFAAATRTEDAPPSRMFVGGDVNMANRASFLMAGRRDAMAAAIAERAGESPTAIVGALAAEATGGTVGAGPRIALPPAADAGADTIEVVEALPWELELVILSAVREMRGGGAADGPVQFGAAAAGLNEPGFAYGGFELTAIGVTRYRVGAGRGNYEAAALLAFEDGAGRRALASLSLKFHVADEIFEIDVETAEAIPVTAVRPGVVTVFVPADALDPAAFADGVVLVQAALENAVDAAAAPPVPADMLVVAIAADRLPDDARLELRIAADGGGIEGYPGRPLMVSRHGMRVLVHRATFALGTAPEIYFKTVFAPGGGPEAGGDGPPVLLAGASTRPDVAAAGDAP